MHKVMLVDDSDMNLEILKNALMTDYDLSFAKNGQLALEGMLDVKPELVLMDVIMPVMDGLEAYKNMKELDYFKDIEVIFLSSLDDFALRLRGEESPRLLKKPFDAEEVKAVINDYFYKKDHNQEKGTLLIVDDMEENLDIAECILEGDYHILKAFDGYKALELARDHKPDLILLDVMMPGMSGYETIEQLKKDPDLSSIPVIFLTANSETQDEVMGLQMGAVDYILKPIVPEVMITRVKNHFKLANYNNELEAEVAKKTKKLLDTQLEIFNILGRAAEYKDDNTGQHVQRVSEYSYVLALACGVNVYEADLLRLAAPMHDIGKIGIADNVLKKAGRLTDEEFESMTHHTTIGAGILGNQSSQVMKYAQIIALQHHEKWNGKGYPKGLKGEDIHLFSRIVAIADVFDALTSKRPYKESWSIEDAVDLLLREKGQQFDPMVVDIFVDNIDKIIDIYNRIQ